MFNIPSGTAPNIKGVSIIKPRPTLASQERATTRKILREAWGKKGSIVAQLQANPKNQQGNLNVPKLGSIGNFRAVYNAGDLLSRVNYSCGGPDMIGSGPAGTLVMTTKDGGQSKRNCDGSGVPPQTCNVRYVYDSSNFTRFKREQAVNRSYTFYAPNYNGSNGGNSVRRLNTGFDYSYGGANNGAFTAISRVRR